MRTLSFALISIVATTIGMEAQQYTDVSVQDSGQAQTESPLVFPAAQPVSKTGDSSETPHPHSWGLDILVSTGGVGMGGFYRYEFTKDVSGFVTLSVSEAKDDREFEFVNPYTGISFVPGKKNRFLVIPVLIGVQQRLFSNQILDNFRPYLSAAVGPTLVYASPYSEEFFASLGKGRSHYTVGGYIGAGAYIGSDRSALFSLNMRYYVVPYHGGIESLEQAPPKKEFGGFFITLSFGSTW